MYTGKVVESAQWSKMKHFESNMFNREWEMKLYHLAKVMAPEHSGYMVPSSPFPGLNRWA